MDKYPWLNFTINLQTLSFQTWIHLGECLSKIEHISKVPLTPTISKEMHTVYLVKGVQATTAIEGNTLSEQEVRLRLEKQLELPSSKEYLGQEVDNIIFLCNKIMDTKISSQKESLINCQDILYYNETILKNIPLPEHVTPGKFRTYSVGVGSYRAPDHNDVQLLMDEYCKWLNSDYFIIDKNNFVLNNIVKAISSHLYFAWIHPFGDGNGRTARIIEFYILLSSGVPSPAAHLLSNHYNATRSEYYRQLDESRKKGDISGFLSYAVQGFCDGLREQLDYIFKQVIDISWESYVYEKFRGTKHHETTTKRRRDLLLELSRKLQPIPINEMITLSKKIVDEYRNKTTKTLSRDIKELEKLNLIEKTDKGYRAKKNEIMLDFVPKIKK